jgi:hypothetical protein
MVSGRNCISHSSCMLRHPLLRSPELVFCSLSVRHRHPTLLVTGCNSTHLAAHRHRTFNLRTHLNFWPTADYFQRRRKFSTPEITWNRPLALSCVTVYLVMAELMSQHNTIMKPMVLIFFSQRKNQVTLLFRLLITDKPFNMTYVVESKK